MKKLKLFMPVLAFTLAITGVFALSSSTALISEEEVFIKPATFLFAPNDCRSCNVEDACTVPIDPVRCLCLENGAPAFLPANLDPQGLPCNTPYTKPQE